MQAIWAKDCFEQNTELCFYTDVERHKSVLMKLMAKDVYNLYVNGRFVAYGPARAAKGYVRTDVFDLTGFCNRKKIR